MIEFKSGSRKMLIPHNETPRHDSELHLCVGSLLAERVRCYIQELNVVKVDDASDNSHQSSIINVGVINNVKKLILKMTRVKPEDRIFAAEALSVLADLSQRVHKVCYFHPRTHELTVHLLLVKPLFGVLHNSTLD